MGGKTDVKCKSSSALRSQKLFVQNCQNHSKQATFVVFSPNENFFKKSCLRSSSTFINAGASKRKTNEFKK